MKKRVLALLLVSAMVVTSLIGCGNSDESKKDSAKTETTENSSDNKEETKKVVVATAGTGEPYSLMSDDGKWMESMQKCGMRLKNVLVGK